MKHIAFRTLVTLVVLLLICGNTYALIDSEVTIVNVLNNVT